MKRKIFAAACLFTAAASGPAQAQQPSIASAWGDMKLSLQECLSQGKATFERLKFTRIEAVGYSVYGDSGNFQYGIRCLNDRNIFFIFGGGPGDQDKRLLQQIDEIKAAFQR